jgi:hypothetical protein
LPKYCFLFGFYHRHLRARKDIIVPLLTPIKGMNGTDIGEIHIPNGTGIMIGVLFDANRNPAIWHEDATNGNRNAGYHPSRILLRTRTFPVYAQICQ